MSTQTSSSTPYTMSSIAGAPIEPTMDPMTAGLGPAAWAERADHPDLTVHGEPKIVPMRVATSFSVASGDPDPRGMVVIGCDGETAGVVSDIWVDRSEPQVRYLEVKLASGAVALMPMPVARVRGRDGVVTTKSITAAQFASVPRTGSPDQVTLLEEDKIMGYFAGGYLYATPERSRPVL